MIKANGVEISPTRFPDGTTQAWKLPPEMIRMPELSIDWRFEREDEFFMVAQLRALFHTKPARLYVPYLPYARQDKEIANDRTFALDPFATLLNALHFDRVTVMDVHNSRAAEFAISNLEMRTPIAFHSALVEKISPKTIIFPDKGAFDRYPWLHSNPYAVFRKKRDQGTGKILGMELLEGKLEVGTALMVDDICDGGATFLAVEAALGDVRGQVDLHLFVTHGLFSKGKKPLQDAGITLHTTDSLPRNADGFAV